MTPECLRSRECVDEATPEALVQFCDMIGVAKANSTVDIGKLEFCVRDRLNQDSPRIMAVINPIRVTSEGGPEETEWLDAPLFPHDIPLDESRKVPFTSTVYIEREDFEETPSPGFKRLTLGGVVRLRYACIIRCTEVVRDDTGEIVELKCQVVPNSRSGADTSGVKVKAPSTGSVQPRERL